jgi:hypothetical protein
LGVAAGREIDRPDPGSRNFAVYSLYSLDG